MIFFEIGGTDVTPYMDIQNYEMTEEQMYETWTDANGTEHRNVYRTKVTGKFKLGFKTKAELHEFISWLGVSISTDGYYHCIAHISNVGCAKCIDCFIETEAESKWDFVNSRQWHEVTCKVTER